MTWFVGVPVAFTGPEPLVREESGISATRVADRHVTLVFLGQVADADAERCWRSLPTLSLPAAVDPVGWALFGRRAIVVTLADAAGLVTDAMDLCHDAAAGVFDLQPPAPHRPHVTLARVRRRATPPPDRTLRGWPLPGGPVALGPVTLFRSRPGGTGDRYERVEQQDPLG